MGSVETSDLIKISKETILSDIADKKPHVTCALVNGYITEITKIVDAKDEVKLLSADENEEAARVFLRGMLLLAGRAANEMGSSILVEYVLPTGVFCRFLDIKNSDENFNRLRELIEKYISEDTAIGKMHLTTAEAVEFFKKLDKDDKVRLLKYRAVQRITIYTSANYAGYYYGIMVDRTGRLKDFEMEKCCTGFILSGPTPYKNAGLPLIQPKLAEAFRISQQHANILLASNVADLNYKIESGNFREFIQTNEALFERSLVKVAEDIIKRENVKIILISGPSSSGKTTTAYRLKIELSACGKKCIMISLDDFYLERATRISDENGKVDFESLEALDLELINTQLKALLAGEDVMLPIYDFATGKRTFGEKVCLQKDDILIIEGIHGLNTKLTESISDDLKYKIFISPLFPVNLDNENPIFPEDIRLLRRMVRDKLFRGRDFLTTLAKWDEVREGEYKHILPYIENADRIINTTLLYEAAILKKYVYDELSMIEHLDVRAGYLKKFLNYFETQDAEDIIPKNSIIREFIGRGII